MHTSHDTTVRILSIRTSERDSDMGDRSFCFRARERHRTWLILRSNWISKAYCRGARRHSMEYAATPRWIDLILVTPALAKLALSCQSFHIEHGFNHRATDTSFFVPASRRAFKRADWNRVRQTVALTLDPAPTNIEDGGIGCYAIC